MSALPRQGGSKESFPQGITAGARTGNMESETIANNSASGDPVIQPEGTMKELLGLLSKCYSLSENPVLVGLPIKAQPAGPLG